MVVYSPPAPTKPKRRVVYFSSGSGIGELSNFAYLEEPLQYKGLEYNSSEHCYMAMRVVRKHRYRFAVGGDLSDLTDASVSAVYGISDAQQIAKKRKYWSAKGTRPAMPGIIAKLATKPSVAARLQIELKKGWNEERRSEQELIDIFVPILIAKYRANPKLKEVLINTGKDTLVEFSKSAVRDPSTSRWTGLMDKETGMLHGGNLQGRIHMIVRHMLRTETTSGVESA